MRSRVIAYTGNGQIQKASIKIPHLPSLHPVFCVLPAHCVPPLSCYSLFFFLATARSHLPRCPKPAIYLGLSQRRTTCHAGCLSTSICLGRKSLKSTTSSLAAGESRVTTRQTESAAERYQTLASHLPEVLYGPTHGYPPGHDFDGNGIC